jgi:release factor glutamine methyltransferase
LRRGRRKEEGGRRSGKEVSTPQVSPDSSPSSLLPPPFFKRLLRRALHVCVYYFVVRPSRARTRLTRAGGFRLVLRPTVFHPKFFLSSEIFARYIRGLDLRGKRVADVGTGSGILALAAARAGAARVVAVDVNPQAALSAAENARANGVGDRVSVVCGDLLSAVAPVPAFDAIFSNPPFFPGEPRDLADRAWHAGPSYRDIEPLFDQARARLAPEAALYLILSSDADLAVLHALFARAGFVYEVVDERHLFFERMLIYRVRPS